MNWDKKPLRVTANENLWWQQNYAILPTPFLIEELNIIRVFYATTCKSNIGRITSVDLCADDPSKIISQNNIISLDSGLPGAFDDCGVNPSSILKINDLYVLYYAGYQRHEMVPYSILSGIAISNDLKSFKRISNSPVLERNDTELNLRSAPTVIEHDSKYFMVYVSSLGWQTFDEGFYKGKTLPKYCLRSTISEDGFNWNNESKIIIEPDFSNNEFGFGRPYLLKHNSLYYLFYSVRSSSNGYNLGYAVSSNLEQWFRKDKQIGISRSKNGWDSEMICYCSMLIVRDKLYMFYNGNNHGKSGFGFAECNISDL
jgi:predicted GH43/DUF377 family glycosyl hydrolase